MIKNTYWILLMGCWLMVACENASNKSDASDVIATDSTALDDTIQVKDQVLNIEPIGKEIYDKQTNYGFQAAERANENLSLLQDSSFIKLKDTVYTIKLKNDSSLQLVELSNEEYIDNYVNYTYAGKLPGTELMVFVCSYYEAYDYLLVNQENGQQTYMWGVPSLSPDRKHILSFNYDLAAAFTPNGIQLYEIGNQGLTLVFEKEFDTWGPESPKWVDNNTIYLVQSSQNLVDGNDQKSYAKIVLK